MSRTAVTAGRLVAVYVDDGQGRRLLLGEAGNAGSIHVITTPIIAATTKCEARSLIAALRGLVDELPDEPVMVGAAVKP